MTKIDIISGFLGAGKTTFIKKLLEEAISGEQVVLIENEFGQVGIDGGFLKDSGIEIREMNSGCICCSLVGDFGKSLEEVLTKYHPERVIIEPSGVGKLSDVMKAVRDVAATVSVELNSAVTIVDVTKCKMYMKNFGEFFNNQVENAGTIVLSRTDLAAADKLEQAIGMIREKNKSASIVTTPIDRLNGTQLLEIIEKPDTMEQDLLAEVVEHRHEANGHHKGHGEGCGCKGHGDHEGHDDDHGGGCGCKGHGHHGDHDDDREGGCGCKGHGHHGNHGDHSHDEGHHGEHCGCGQDHDHHHADEVFTSWGMEAASSLTREELDRVLDELAYGDGYGQVLRAKGMIPGEKDDKWYYFDLVPEQYEIREGSPNYTGKVCVIGAELDEEALKNVFGRS